MSIFSRPDFVSLSQFCEASGTKLFVATKSSDGVEKTFGNGTEAIAIFDNAKTSKKRLSGDWIPKNDPKPQNLPLKEYVMNITKVIMEFRGILRFFVGKAKFGRDVNGQCFWDTRVNKDALHYSTKALTRNRVKSLKIALSDVIEWKDVNVGNLANHPAKSAFKIKVG